MTYEEIKASIVEAIRTERVAQKVALVPLSKRLGINVSNLSQIERGKLSASMKQLQSICDELGIKFDLSIEIEHQAKSEQ